LTTKNALRQSFIEEMQGLVSYRGHGYLYLKDGEDIYDFEVYSTDEIRMMLELIFYGARFFHFVINSSTNLDVEYKGHSLRTKIEQDRYESISVINYNL
jgi:hypothetical protein